MLNGHHNSEELHGSELVAYIYGELDEIRRSSFESHLEACDECVLELANYSDARLGVIEWRREDFDHLLTPAIVILETQPVFAKADGPHSFAGILESIFRLPLFAQAGLGFASAALVVGAIYFAVLTPPVPKNVASNTVRSPEVPSVASEPAQHSEPETTVATGVKNEIPSVAKNGMQRIDKRQYASTESVAMRQISHTPVRKTETAATVKTLNKAAPRLSSFQEDDDKSLRLADLFAEIGSSEE